MQGFIVTLPKMSHQITPPPPYKEFHIIVIFLCIAVEYQVIYKKICATAYFKFYNMKM